MSHLFTKFTSNMHSNILHLSILLHQHIGAISTDATEVSAHALQEGAHNRDVHFSDFSADPVRQLLL